jgi:hypothetical protein
MHIEPSFLLPTFHFSSAFLLTLPPHLDDPYGLSPEKRSLLHGGHFPFRSHSSPQLLHSVLGPEGPSRTAHTAPPHTRQCSQRQNWRSLSTC